MGMTSIHFEEFAALVAELWPRWSYMDPEQPEKSNWNTANRANIFQLLKNYDLSDCCKAIRKQRQWDPDATKPSWSSLVTEVRTMRKGQSQTPDERAIEEQAFRETKRMRDWGFANRHRLDAIEREACRCRPRLRDAISFARRFHGEARVWVCMRWDQGDRFEDFATDADIEAEAVPAAQDDIPF